MWPSGNHRLQNRSYKHLVNTSRCLEHRISDQEVRGIHQVASCIDHQSYSSSQPPSINRMWGKSSTRSGRDGTLRSINWEVSTIAQRIIIIATNKSSTTVTNGFFNWLNWLGLTKRWCSADPPESKFLRTREGERNPEVRRSRKSRSNKRSWRWLSFPSVTLPWILSRHFLYRQLQHGQPTQQQVKNRRA